MSEQVLLTIVVQVSTILSSMHSQHPCAVAHLDIKPDNILVSSAEDEWYLVWPRCEDSTKQGIFSVARGRAASLLPRGRQVAASSAARRSLGCLLYHK